MRLTKPTAYLVTVLSSVIVDRHRQLARRVPASTLVGLHGIRHPVTPDESVAEVQDILAVIDQLP
jgi:DNA-directed RNA polymerase specialized sigma24 family protein